MSILTLEKEDISRTESHTATAIFNHLAITCVHPKSIQVDQKLLGIAGAHGGIVTLDCGLSGQRNVLCTYRTDVCTFTDHLPLADLSPAVIYAIAKKMFL